MFYTASLIMLALASDPQLDVAHLPAGPADSGEAALIRQAGSIAKYVCTLTALRMENQGLLSLDAPVSALLPGYAGPDDQALTLRRLLENRSGLEDEVIRALMSDPDLPNQSIASLEAANRFGATNAVEEPGEVFDYVNSNWIVVQAILEAAGDAPVAELVEHWVLEPAGAHGASFFVGDISGPDRATAQGQYLPLPDFIACAGALEARAEDLMALVAYPFQSSDFDDEDRTNLTTITTPGEVYSIGGRFETVLDEAGQGRQISWQSGNNGPWFAIAVYDPETEEGLAVMGSAGGDEILSMRDAWLAERNLSRAPRHQE